ncbi:rtn-like domain protein [Shigella flexneri 1235-66]|nr:rtn-like domain protein [Shigella flexneri 1235-66]
MLYILPLSIILSFILYFLWQHWMSRKMSLAEELKKECHPENFLCIINQCATRQPKRVWGLKR